MKLPNIQRSDGIATQDQTRFAGLNRRRGAGDGEICDMRNLCSNDYPVLSTRPLRAKYATLTKANGMFAWDGLAWVDGTGFYFNGVRKGTVADSRKRFAGIGAYIIIMPDKACYNTETGVFAKMEAIWSGESLTFQNGTLYGVSATANTIKSVGTQWSEMFRAGDAVTISGCTVHTENNKTPIIREIIGDELHFYENVFTLDEGEPPVAYTETGELSVGRLIPQLDYICENDNRLWGCHGNEIYASALGDIFNWNDYDGLNTDSYAVDVGSAGAFTGTVSFSSYPTFFKSDRIYRMYGNYPSNYQLMGSATMGLAQGSDKSAAVAGETLFYLSRTGFVAYTGGIPSSINEVFGTERFKNAVAGSDGLKYFVSAENEDGKHLLMCYDSEYRVWHIEDESEALDFAWHDDNLYMLTKEGVIWVIGNVSGRFQVYEDPVSWSMETADFTEDSPNKKIPTKLQIRVELGEKAWARAYIMYDSSGEWVQAGNKVTASAKKSYYIPVVPHRCDHYRIKLEGCGECRIYGIARQLYGIKKRYSGSELKSTPYTNY